MLALAFTHLLNIASWITVSAFCALYRLLTWSFTLQLNLLGLLLVFILILTVVYLVIHDKHCAQYSPLEPVDATKLSSATFDTHSALSTIATAGDHPDVYLARLLSSTKLFGSLEQPAFREVSRQVQIKNVPMGHLLFNDNGNAEEESFHIVVKGGVDVYIKSNNSKTLSNWDTEDELEEKLKHCTLIRKAGPGDSISGLFTILTSFQECHDRNLAKLQRKQRLQKENQQRPFQRRTGCSEPSLSLRRSSTVNTSSDANNRITSSSSSSSCNSDASSPVLFSFDANASKGMDANAKATLYQGPLTITDNDRTCISTDQQYTNTTTYDKSFSQRSSRIHTKCKQKSVQPNIIAHTTTDTVLAVIPRKTFFSIYRRFPTSANWITKFVLARFQRVTMMTSRHYFGLADQILDMEHFLSSSTKSEDDTSIHCFRNKNALQRLRHEYSTERHEATKTQHVDAANSAAMGNQESDTHDLQERRPDRHKPMSFTSHTAQLTEDGCIRKSIAKCLVRCLGLDTLANTNDDVNSASYSSEASFSRYGLPDNYKTALILQLADYVESQVQIMSFKKGSTLIQEGCKSNGIYFVIDGSLEALVEKDKQDTQENVSMDDKRCSGLPGYLKKDRHNAAYQSFYERVSDQNCKRKRLGFDINPCETAGYFSALTDCPSLFQVCAKTDCLVGYLSKECLQYLSVECPLVMVGLAKRVVNAASPLLLHIDLALDWTQVSAGQIIQRKGDSMDSSLIVIHGRLRLIQEKEDNGLEIISEFARGDGTGELESMTTAPLPWTLHAIRDSEMVRIPKTLLGALMLQYPQISPKISQCTALGSLQPTAFREIARAYTQHLREKVTELPVSYPTTHRHTAPELYASKSKPMYTVGVIPVNNNVPIMAFAERLKLALTDSVGAECALINSAIAAASLGEHASCRYEQPQLATWLTELEQDGRIVLCVADSGERSVWTKTCLQQADCIFLVGKALGDASVGGYERTLIDVKTTARKELVLLHSERFCASGVTKSWLKDRVWIQAHHHVVMPASKPSKQKSSKMPISEHAALSSVSNGSKATSKPIYLYNQIKDRIPLLWNLFSSMIYCSHSQMKKPIFNNQSISADSSCCHSTASQTEETDFAR
ncbi:unnamed protein product [Mucor fragilis]